MSLIVSTPIRYLKNADHNPPKRIEEKNLKDLMLSMETYGLIYPVLIKPNKIIIEGHRRVAAAKYLGWKEINCVTFEGDANALYANINTTAKKMGSNDVIGIWIKNPMAVTPRERERIKQMVDHLGLPLVKKIYNLGYSRAVYKAALQISSYCENKDDDFLKQTVEWLISQPVMGDARRAIAVGESPKILLQAIHNMRPIKFRLAIA